jgi:predicted HicB family RNase H-like nuclease
MSDKIDNIEAAMDKVAENMDMTIAPRAKEHDEPDVPASKQILIRATSLEHERWNRAAKVSETNVSAMVRDVVNAHVMDILDCSHPTNLRRWYPWAEFCLKCNLRIR